MQFIENAGLESERVRHFGANRVARMALIEFGQSAVQHGFADDEFADEVHDGVNTRGVDAQHAFGNGSDSGTCAAIFSSTSGVVVVRRRGGDFLRLGFEKLTE